MSEEIIKIGEPKKGVFIDKVKELLPKGGNLDMCLTCGACSSACPATGIDDMDARKFLRLAYLGQDEEILTSKWAWSCSMCTRCTLVCPMEINIPQLVFNVRAQWAKEDKPKGIIASCDMALSKDTCSAMGITEEDFVESIEDTLEAVHDEQEGMDHIIAPIDKKGAHFYLNQNSREPAMEEDEMVPLWKILDVVGADWTYGTKGFAAENYCLFSADDESWEKIVRLKAKAIDDLGSKEWLNTE